MAFGWSKQNVSPIGIDFGGDSLKLLQITPAVGDQPPQLVAAASRVVDPAARQDPRARARFFAASLKDMLKEGDFKGKRAICALPAYQTLTQHLQVERVESTSLDAQVALTLRSRMNVDPSRMVIRSFEVAKITRDGSTRQEVVCMAASRDSVMQHITTCNAARLDVVGMHCEPLAVLQAFDHLLPDAADPDASRQAICFVDMGASTTKVVIAHGHEMAFAKTLHAGGDHFTRLVADDRRIDFREARELRLKDMLTGVVTRLKTRPSDEQLQMASKAGGMSAIASQLAAERTALDERDDAIPLAADARPGTSAHEPEEADETLECIVDELKMCLRYHRTIFPDHPVARVVFVGGESRCVAHCQKIASGLQIAAQLGDPLARVANKARTNLARGVDLTMSQPGWAVPMGLCLSRPNL